MGHGLCSVTRSSMVNVSVSQFCHPLSPEIYSHEIHWHKWLMVFSKGLKKSTTSTVMTTGPELRGGCCPCAQRHGSWVTAEHVAACRWQGNFPLPHSLTEIQSLWTLVTTMISQHADAAHLPLNAKLQISCAQIPCSSSRFPGLLLSLNS